MKRVLKREKSLERRLIESRGREADLLLKVNELEEKLSLYDTYFYTPDDVRIVDFNYPETETSLDLHMRYDPAEPRFEYLARQNNEPVTLYYHEFVGVLEMAKTFVLSGMNIRRK